MFSPELRAAFAPRARALNVLWVAFLAATVFYVALAMFAVGGSAPADTAAEAPADPWLLAALLAIAAVFAAAAFALLVLARPRVAGFLDGRKGRG